MCSGGCAKCLGGTLIPLALFGFLANILLFFPGGKVIDDNDHLSDEVWFFGGILGNGVLMIFPALVFLGLKNNDCCGCCGNESCGKRFAVSTRRRRRSDFGCTGPLCGAPWEWGRVTMPRQSPALEAAGAWINRDVLLVQSNNNNKI
ncbi:transmembrane 4 L6 family member 4 [Leptonychotes weddellii]|uniref:Transmembrane 4 L6 family member 4 n=1 Tax=Leptonychotes weddellii TaxID=9713 RepID=A0A7F8RWN9_LEPWE|nr:transmembrane 4 L6 family member 4 [Leptonychotes weddellii]